MPMRVARFRRGVAFSSSLLRGMIAEPWPDDRFSDALLKLRGIVDNDGQAPILGFKNVNGRTFFAGAVLRQRESAVIFTDYVQVTPGIRIAVETLGMERDTHHERLCRVWLLAIAILHWVVFALLVRNSNVHAVAPAAARTFAEAVTDFVLRA